MVHPPCPPWEILLWDSGFFACRIGRLNGGRLDAALLSAVDAWCREEAIDCLYFLADAEDPAVARTAEAAGFRLVDLRVTLDREMAALALPPVPDPAPHPTIRPARPEDLPALRRIAAASHRDSRFYADPGFDRARCDELYATWIEESCRGRMAAAVLVAGDGRDGKDGKDAAGYITCRLEGEVGEIGLLAVDEAARGRRLGGALVGAGLAWLAAQGAARARVVTQGRNARAQRLYQAHGLLTRSIGLWFHRWAAARGRRET